VYALFVGTSDSFGSFLPIAVVLLCLVTFLGLIVWGIMLAVNDAKRRGKSPVLVVIACILFFPWGLVAWVLFRPDPIDDVGFRLDDHRVQ
jgi:hypothetical protein